MADDKATYQIQLGVDGANEVLTAASALKQLKTSIDGDTASLAAMQKAMKALQAGTSVDIAQYRELKAKIDAKKQAIAQNTSALLSMGGTLEKTRPGVSRMQQAIDDLKQAAGATGGPLGGLISRVGGLRGLFVGGALVLGVAAVAGGLLALAAAAITASAALFKFGVASADARRNELLHLEGLTKLRFWYQTTRGNAGEMQNAIDRVSGSVAVGRDQVARYTEQLYRMGLRGQNLSDALEGAAITGSVQGDAAASRFMGWVAGANMAGQSVKRFTDDAKARLGGILAKQMLSLDVQTRKMRESWAALFSGVRLDPLLNGLKLVTDLFSQATASGRALKAMLTVAFQPVINGAETAGLIVKRVFQGMVIAALTTGIALLKVRNWLRSMFGDSTILRGMNMQELAVRAGGVAFAVFAGAVALTVGVVAALGAVLVSMGAVVYAAVKPVLILGQAFYQAYQLIQKIEWAALGRSIVQGIVGGLRDGVTWVQDAMKQLGAAALTSFKSALGIASPSKAFMRLGLELPRGVQTGIQRGQPALQSDVARMVPVPDAPAPAARPAAQGAAARATTVIDVGGITLAIQTAATDAKELARDLEPELLAVFRRLLSQLGAA